MRKSELSREQQKERKKIIDIFLTNGWKDLSVGDWFEKDFWAETEINMGINVNDVNLEFQLAFEDRSINLIIEDQSGRELLIIFYPGENVFPLIEKLMELQEDFSIRNYKNCINDLVKVCPQAFTLSEDSEELIKVVPE